MSTGQGFGRGGRGEALRKALEQPIRMPGELQQQTTPAATSEGVPSQPQSTPQQSTPVGRGRAGLLQLLQQHAQQTTSPVQQRPPVASYRPPGPPTNGLHHPPPGPPHGSTQTFPPVVSPPGQLSGPPGPPPATQQPTSVQPRVSTKGTVGSQLNMKANYLKLITNNDAIYQYTVSYSPVVENNNVRFALLNNLKDVIGDTKAFDGATLYLPVRITDSSITRSVCNMRDGSMVSVTVQLFKVLRYEECTHLLNLVFKRAMRKLKLQQVGRNTYDPSNSIKIPQHKLELWPGYVTAITRKEDGLLLMLDISHRVLRDETALDFFYDMYEHHKHGFQEEATRQLLGAVVLTRYNNRTYRVDDIAWDMNPQSTFIDSNGQPVRFLDYYKSKYNLEIADYEQPLLIHRERKREVRGQPKGERQEAVICLIPELCSMTGLTDMARSDFRVMKDIAAYTKITPAQRDLGFKKFLNNLSTNPEAMKELTSWGLQLSHSTLNITGRLLPSEKITFGRNTIELGPNAEFNKEVGSEAMITAVPLKNWVIVFSRKDHSRAFEFINTVKKVCAPLGMDISEPQPSELPDDRTETYLAALRQAMHSHLQMVVCVFPTARDDRYSAVKKFCCCEKPVPSQCINSRTLGNPQKLRSVTQKILLQMNAKLGGELWAVEVPLKSLMVIGIDVYHEKGNRSVAGFVASMNRSLTRWFSKVVFQTQREELVTGLSMCMEQALKSYHKANGQLPERIVVFRDGVGEGQMKYLLEMEIPQMISSFSTFGDQYQPKFATVVVQKRINTRLFAIHGGELRNPIPGAVLDHTITRYPGGGDSGGYDFFLVSQNVREGTVTPSHYHVIYDTSNLKPDHMQRLAYKLTFMYYNWPGTIRVPAPCQYAHKLAFLVGQSLRREPSLELSNRLFFL